MKDSLLESTNLKPDDRPEDKNKIVDANEEAQKGDKSIKTNAQPESITKRKADEAVENGRTAKNKPPDDEDDRNVLEKGKA